VNKTQSFVRDGIVLDIPEDCLSGALVEALQSGRYEHSEAAALLRHLTARDRVLDIGAGAGFLSALAARVVGASMVTAVEANPHMQTALRRNLDQNGASATRLVHGAVVPDGFSHPLVRFHARTAFWAGAIARDDAQDHPRAVDVPAVKLGDLLAETAPSVVVMDVEGAEAELAGQSWPAHVRLIVLEIHMGQYGAAGIQRVFDGFSRSGLTYMPWGSRGETLVFQRVAAQAGKIPKSGATR